MEITKYIEAILFMRGEPVKKSELTRILSIPQEEITEAVEVLEKELSNRGVRLMQTGDSLLLTTAPEVSGMLQSMAKDDISSEIGKAGMEVLTIVLYASPVNRRHIDYIRGVNSSSTLRTLVLKGIVERQKTKSGQGFSYTPTAELLAFLGLSKTEDLLHYQTLRDKFLGTLNQEEMPS